MSESEQTAEQKPRGSEHLDQQVASILDRVVKELSQDIETKIRQSAETLAAEMVAAGGRERDSILADLVAAVARVDGESTQAGILATLMKEGSSFASRLAFLITEESGIRGWGGRGFGEHVSQLNGLELGSASESWAAFSAGRGSIRLDSEGCGVLSRAIGAEDSAEGVLIPFVLGGHIAGVVYADRVNGDGAIGVEALQLLTHSAAEAVETLAYRSRKGSPTLRFGDGSADSEASEALEGLPFWKGAAAAVAGVTTRVAKTASAGEETGSEPYIETAPVPIVNVPVIEEAMIDEPEVDEPRGPQASTDLAAEEDPVTAAVPTGLDLGADPGPGEDSMPAEALFEVSAEVEAEPEEPSAAQPKAGLDSLEVDAPPVIVEDDEPAGSLPSSKHDETASDIWALEEDEGDELTATGPMEAVRESAEVNLAEIAQEAESLTVEESREDAAPAPGLSGQEAESVDTSMDQDPTISLEPGKKTVLLDLNNLGETPADANEIDTAPIESIPRERESRYLDASEDPTIMTSRLGMSAPSGSAIPGAPTPSFASPPSGSFALPKPVGEGTAATSFGDSVVQPPEDHHGPGLAFSGMSSSSISSGDAALHDQAKRLARLLVSEIKLYNEEIIEEGRRSRNIYQRLREDIDRSRQLYEERVDPRVRGGEDYFHLELVQLLAGGDASLLGI